jgi:hydroxymethylbilane synthase
MLKPQSASVRISARFVLMQVFSVNTPFPSPQKIVIATRESRLALWQARHIQARLHTLYPACDIQLLGMTTQGDRILDRPLSKVGGKGLFVKELETALLNGQADLAVHSMKDVPMQMESAFSLAAICERENPLDAFVSSRYESLEDMPPGTSVGTSSLRRAAQVHAQYPHLAVSSVRGNLDTRLRKLDEGQFDALLLAAAGLIRLGLQARIRAVLPASQSLPAPGQGALGLQIRAEDSAMAHWLSPLSDPLTSACVNAERAVARAFGASCEVPLAAYAAPDPEIPGSLVLEALVALPDGTCIVRHQAKGHVADANALANEVIDALKAQGAQALLDRLV